MNKTNIIVSFADISFTIIFFILLSISSGNTQNTEKNISEQKIKIIDNRLYWENRDVDINFLDKILKEYKQDIITIESNKNTTFKEINRVINTIKSNKIKKIVFCYDENN